MTSVNPRGICCEKCGYEDMPVLYTRKQAGEIRRRRRCPKCDARVTTMEIVVSGSTNGTKAPAVS